LPLGTLPQSHVSRWVFRNEYLALKHLVAFVSLTRHGSFTRASAALGISQPSLTAMIKQLEAASGVQLFERRIAKIHLMSPPIVSADDGVGHVYSRSSDAVPPEKPVTVRKRIAINSGCEGLCPDAASGSRWGFVLLGCHHVRPSAFDPAVALGPFNKYAQQRIAASLSGFSSSNCGNTL
jgi:hypothetical protein